MKLEQVVSILIIGILVAFACGFLVGSNGRERVVEPRPSNYDPIRAMADDAIKSAQASEQLCWGHLLEQRQKEITH